MNFILQLLAAVLGDVIKHLLDRPAYTGKQTYGKIETTDSDITAVLDRWGSVLHSEADPAGQLSPTK